MGTADNEADARSIGSGIVRLAVTSGMNVLANSHGSKALQEPVAELLQGGAYAEYLFATASRR